MDVRSDPGQSGCIVAHNVSFLGDGQVATRPGFSDFETTLMLPPVAHLLLGDGGTHIMSYKGGTDREVRAFAADGSEAAASGSLVSSQADTNFVRFGGAAGNRTYFGYATGSSILRWDGATFTSVVTPWAGYLAVTPWDNRLVIAAASRVHFSAPGDPETYDALDYVDLDPGDGEQIIGAVAWRELVFVFKQSKFYVFTGTATDSTGGAVFNYRAVRGVGLAAYFKGGCTAGTDAVFFVARDGIYRTTGGVAERISRPLDPLFGSGPLSPLAYPTKFDFLSGSTYDNVQIAWHDERLFVPVRTARFGPTDLLVWHAANNKWSTWSTASTALTAVQNGATFDRQLMIAPGFQQNQIKTFGDETATSDDGAAIVASYQSGFNDMGMAGVEKTIRETELVGTGAPSFSWTRDFATAATGTTVTLGTSPATARGRHRTAYRGNALSWRVSSASGYWRLNRVVPFMRDQRPAPERTS